MDFIVTHLVGLRWTHLSCFSAGWLVIARLELQSWGDDEAEIDFIISIIPPHLIFIFVGFHSHYYRRVCFS